MTLTLTGDVKPGDKACDYLLSDKVMYELGNARKNHLKLQKGKKDYYLADYNCKHYTGIWRFRSSQCVDCYNPRKRKTSYRYDRIGVTIVTLILF